MKRFQNKVAESRYALTLMAIYALGIWYLGGLVENRLFLQLAFLCVSTYLMMEINNSNALIRIYSRMVSCSFLALTSMATFLYPSLRESIVQLCLITSYTIIFHIYQDKDSPGLMFYAFLCLGIASVLFIQVLYIVPLLWLLIGFKMMAFSFRMFCASIVGLITPYWFLAPLSFFTGHFDSLVEHITSIAYFQPLFQYQRFNDHHYITFAFVCLVALIGMVHYLRNSHMDKIRTQMIYELLMWMNLFTVVFIILQPQHFEILLGMMIVNTSPFIGHFLALTHTKLTNVTFYMLIFLILFITAYNLWIP